MEYVISSGENYICINKNGIIVESTLLNKAYKTSDIKAIENIHDLLKKYNPHLYYKAPLVVEE